MTLLFSAGWLIFLAVAVEALTEILVDAKITQNLRDWIFKRGNPYPHNYRRYRRLAKRARHCLRLHWRRLIRTTPLWSFINAIFKCGYCMSVWVAMPFACFGPNWFGFWFFPLNWGINVLLLHRLSNWVHVVFMLVKKGRVRTIDLEIKLQPIEMHCAMTQTPSPIFCEIPNGHVGSLEPGEGTPDEKE